MNLMGFSPDDIKIELKGESYTIEYSILSLRELEAAYGTEEAYMQVIQNFAAKIGFTKDDFINFFYAGLLHTKLFADYIDKRKHPWSINRDGIKEYLSSLILPREVPLYIILILAAWMRCYISPEMAEILDIMSQSNDDQKKTMMKPQNGSGDMPM